MDAEEIEDIQSIENNMQISEHVRFFGEFLGMVATFCFTIQYIPQAYQNFKRKSCKGFSSTGIIIKLIGAAFLMINAYLTGETSSVVAYGLFNVIQHSIFMIQFAFYMNNTVYYLWLLFPVIPLFLGTVAPFTMYLTNMIKPGAQVMSHIPQLHLCYKLKTTSGVSLKTQHLNMIGGVCGLIMCFIIPPKSTMTYFLYTNSMLQAISLYILAFMYDYKKTATSTTSVGVMGDIESQPFLGNGIKD